MKNTFSYDSESNLPDLFKCPFCGCIANYSVQRDRDDSGIVVYSAGCRNCLIYTPWDTSIIHSAKVWNKRKND